MIIKHQWFWAWQDDQEEAWLHEMALNGFHLLNAGILGSYRFIESAPRNDFYRLDYTNVPSKDKSDYLKPFLENGWAHVGQKNGWQYFRKTAKPGEIPAILDSRQAKANKHQQLMMFLVGAIPFMLILPPLIGKRLLSPLFGILRVFYFILLILYAIATYKIYKRINQLREL